ncbi:MAG TPA: hypothetical protein VHT05_14120 [Candidatus Elarobacter sp.]|nr:hypothetical protein [Candidatus Elarobacter sp.]
MNRIAAILTIALVLAGRAAGAQSDQTPPPAVVPLDLPPAGVIPASISLAVTGSPATEADVVEAQIRAALTRAIRPTLRPGAAMRFGAIAPWPLLPLATGSTTAIDVAVTIDGDASSPVAGTTTVDVYNVPLAPARPRMLFLSDDPEYLQSDGIVFRGNVALDRPARLYYYHSDIGLPRDLDVVVTAASKARVQVIASGAGPDLDVMSVGHSVSRDLLRFEQGDEGALIDVEPGRPFVLRHGLLLQGEVLAGAADVRVVSGGPVTISVLSSPAGSRPDAVLAGPRVAYDGHHRHGVFDLDGFGAIAASYTVGGPDASAQYGGRSQTLRNVDPNDPGRDYGDYGVLHSIAFTLINPSDDPQSVYLYEKPLGGPVRSTFVIDGQLKEVGCVRLQQPYWVTTYQLPPRFTGVSTILTMTDGGSFYPLELGATTTQPLAYTPPVGSPDGCSPNLPPFVDPTPPPSF